MLNIAVLRADAEPEGDDGEKGEAGRPEELAEGEAKVGQVHGLRVDLFL